MQMANLAILVPRWGSMDLFLVKWVGIARLLPKTLSEAIGSLYWSVYVTAEFYVCVTVKNCYFPLCTGVHFPQMLKFVTFHRYFGEHPLTSINYLVIPPTTDLLVPSLP